ncbi:MAG: TGS domain-containing protein [Sulfolobales archaeon]
MVTNLPPEARAKFVKYQEARTPEEKLQALQEFLSAVPKHKGTENLVRWIRRRMAELREEIEERKRSSSRGGGRSFFIAREGDVQIVMLGLMKSGKSSILKTLTNARVIVSDTPSLTTAPIPGMFVYKDIYFQLIEAPSLSEDPEARINRMSISLARNADCLLLVIDLSRDPVYQYSYVRKLLEDEGIKITKPRGRIEIIRSSGSTGVSIINFGRLLDASIDDIRKLLESYKIQGVEVRIYGEISLEDIESYLIGVSHYKPTIIIASKKDLDPKGFNCEMLRKEVEKEIPILCTETSDQNNLIRIGDLIIETMDLIRVYTKPPHGEISKRPLVLRRGATVLDVARAVHEDLYKGFLYARVWGPSVRYPGVRVGRDHVVKDGDIIEIHYKIVGD